MIRKYVSSFRVHHLRCSYPKCTALVQFGFLIERLESQRKRQLVASEALHGSATRDAGGGEVSLQLSGDGGAVSPRPPESVRSPRGAIGGLRISSDIQLLNRSKGALEELERPESLKLLRRAWVLRGFVASLWLSQVGASWIHCGSRRWVPRSFVGTLWLSQVGAPKLRGYTVALAGG